MSFHFSQDASYSRRWCSSLGCCNRDHVYNNSIADMMVEAKAYRQAGRSSRHSCRTRWAVAGRMCVSMWIWDRSQSIRISKTEIGVCEAGCGSAQQSELVKVRRVIHLIQPWWCLCFWWTFTKQSVTALLIISPYFVFVLFCFFRSRAQNLAHWLGLVS